MNLIKKHIQSLIKEEGITNLSEVNDFIFNKGWDRLKESLMSEGKFSNFLKRVKQQKKEVEEYKRKNPNKPLGSVEDFQRFDNDNKKIMASKKVASLKNNRKK